MTPRPAPTSSVRRLSRFAAGVVSALGLLSGASAATINLAASDALNESSFATGLRWTGGAAPTAGNAYVVGTGLRLRTAGDANNYTFAGDSLTIANGFSTANINTTGSADLFGLSHKGTGTNQIYTINNLILAGGSINQIQGLTNNFILAGNLSITADSIIRSRQGPITLRSAISGTSTLYLGATDGLATTRSITIDGNANTFTGNIVATATSTMLIVSANGNLKFAPTTNGVSNHVTGLFNATSTNATVTLNGRFDIDLTNASTTIGDSWTLVDAASLLETYGPTFSIAGFSEVNNVWTGSRNGHYYQFSEATGVLTVIDTPATFPNPTIISAPRSNTVLIGANVTLSVSASGLGNLTYQWAKGATPISGATTNTLTLTNVQTTDSETYTVTVSDDAALANSQPATTSTASATLNVIAEADATLAYYRFEDGTATAPLTTGIDSTAGANNLTANGTLTYAASVPYPKVPRTAANNTLSAAFPAAGNNGLVAPISGGLADAGLTSFTVEAFVNHSSVAGIQTYVGRDDSAVPGQSPGQNALFYLQKSGAGFRLEVTDKSNVILSTTGGTAAVNTWYHVAAVGDAAAGTLKLYVNGTEVGSVAGFTGLLVPPGGSDTPWTLGRGDYNILDADYFRGNLDEVRFSRVALAPTQFLNNTGSGVLTNPVITQAPANQTVRVTGTATFSVTATGTGTLSYQWSKNGTPISGATSATLTLNNVATSDEATYSVTVSDASGASLGIDLSASAQAVLRVLDVPAAARAIGLNFVGAAPTNQTTYSSVISDMLAADSAGIVPIVNWNDSASANAVSLQTTPLVLAENSGASSGQTTATWTSVNTWAGRATGGEPAAKDANVRLFHGYIESRAATGAVVNVSNIPYATYDVYVYVAGGTNNGNNVGSISLDRAGATYFYRGIAHDGLTTATPATLPLMIGDATTREAALAAPAASFVRFAGVTGTELAISSIDSVANANSGGIAAIQIVDRSAPGASYPPLFSASPATKLVKGGANVTFTGTAVSQNSGGSVSYQWQKNGVDLSGQTAASLTLNAVTGADSANYTVIATDTSSLGTSINSRTASLVVVDGSRSLLINGDLNSAASPSFATNGVLLADGQQSPATFAQAASTWNGLVGAAGTATLALSRESTGLALPGLSFTYADAGGTEDNNVTDLINDSVSRDLMRDYLYTDSTTVPLRATIGGLQAFAGHRFTLLVYAYGKTTAAQLEATTEDAANVSLADANNDLAQAAQLTKPYITAFTFESAARRVEVNNPVNTGGAASAYVAFSGVVAVDGTVTWNLGADADLGRIALNGFQLLLTGENLAPAAPTNLAAVAGNTEVSLSWTASSGATSYTIRRGTAPGVYTTINAGSVLGTTFTDTGLTNGTTYYYVVAAANGIVTGTVSNEASATPVASLTGIQSWRQDNFGTTADTGNAANSADPDGDGQTNLLEYALGTDPNAAGILPVTVARSGNFLTLTFNHVDDPALVYTIEASDNLTTWGVERTYPAFTTDGTETYTDDAPLSGQARRFLRLGVTAP